MGIFSRFEGRVEDTFEGAANKMFDSPLSPVQIAKKAEKKMRREKIVGAGKQYAPTLYTVLVNDDDDRRLFGYYPTLAGETETFLAAKAVEEGLTMDGQPLVRFIVDDSLKRGKFDIIAELVASPIIAQLRKEEMDRYGIGQGQPRKDQAPQARAPQQQGYAEQRNSQPRQAPQRGPGQPLPDQYAYDQGYDGYGYEESPGQQNRQSKPPLPYVPEDELDYSIDYGEYTFDSQNFDDYRPERRISVPLADPAAAALGRGGSPNPPAGAGSVGGAVAGAAGAAIAGAVPSPGSPDAAAWPQGQVEAPNTVVFASGSGNARPTPDPTVVRAALLNATDNRTYDLATARLLLGRESSNDIVVDDINASRVHAEVHHEPQGVWVITDLGSTNGTLVNGREVHSQVLRDGDYITIGMTNFVFIQV